MCRNPFKHLHNYFFLSILVILLMFGCIQRKRFYVSVCGLNSFDNGSDPHATSYTEGCQAVAFVSEFQLI